MRNSFVCHQPNQHRSWLAPGHSTYVWRRSPVIRCGKQDVLPGTTGQSLIKDSMTFLIRRFHVPVQQRLGVFSRLETSISVRCCCSSDQIKQIKPRVVIDLSPCFLSFFLSLPNEFTLPPRRTNHREDLIKPPPPTPLLECLRLELLLTNKL